MAASVDVSELRAFFDAMANAAKGGFKKELQLLLEATGFDFLRTVQDEIKRLKVMDTRLLLHSFAKSADGNIWELEEGGLTLQVGSSVKYAAWVNDGHWLNPQGVAVRFVPGVWRGDRFIYQKGAKTGMVLRQKWVEGRHYFDSALSAYVKTFHKNAEEVLQEWMDKYFKF